MNYLFSPAILILDIFACNKKCFIYGDTAEADSLLEKYPKIADRIIDKKLTNIGKNYKNLIVSTIEDVQIDSIVINAVTAAHFGDVEDLIKTKTINTLHVFDFLQLLEKNHQFEQTIISKIIYDWSNFPIILRENSKIFKDFLDALSDNESKVTFESYMNSRLTGNFRYLSSINNFHNPDTMYFCDFLGDLEKYSFIDIGAYDGANSIEFCKKYPSAKSFCFEPEETQFKIVKEKTSKFDNIQAFNECIGSSEKDVHFVSNFSGSHIVNNLKINNKSNQKISLIKQITLDSFVFKKNLIDKPIFVKFDVEGAEIDVLKGGIKSLSKIDSIVAISAYHKSSDIVDFWPIIKEISLGKKIFFRHFTCGACESVIFITP